MFFYNELDDPVLSNLQTFRGKKLESIETASDLPDKDEDDEDAIEKDESVVKDFNRWIRDTLEDKVPFFFLFFFSSSNLSNLFFRCLL